MSDLGACFVQLLYSLPRTGLTFPPAEVGVLQVVVVDLEAPEEVVLLGEAAAVGESGAQGAAQGPGRRGQPRAQLLRLRGQRRLLLCGKHW